MKKEDILILEISKEDAQDFIIALDTVVKSQGLSVAERCSQLHKLILDAKPKVTQQPRKQMNPIKIPHPEEMDRMEEEAKQKMNKESDSLSDKEKKETSKKSSKSKSTKKIKK